METGKDEDDTKLSVTLDLARPARFCLSGSADHFQLVRVRLIQPRHRTKPNISRIVQEDT